MFEGRIRGAHEANDELVDEQRSNETPPGQFTISWPDETQRLSFTASETSLLGLVPPAKRRDNRENAIAFPAGEPSKEPCRHGSS